MPGKNYKKMVIPGVCERMDSISSMPKLSEAFFEPLNTSNLCWRESCSSFSTIHPPGLKFLEAAGCLPETNLRFLEAAGCLPETNLRFLEAAGCLPETNLRFLQAAQHCLGDAVPLWWLYGGCLQKHAKTRKTW